MSSTTRRARSRAATGPRAISAPIRRLGEAALVSEVRYTTRPSRSAASSVGGGRCPCASHRPQSSSITNAPAAAAAASTASRRGPASTVPAGLLVGRLAVEGQRAGAGEGVGQQVGEDAEGVGRHRHRAQARRPGHGQRAGVGGRLDQQPAARRHQGAEGGRDGALTARGDHDVAGVGVRAGRAGEPGPQAVQARHRGPVPGVGQPGGTGQRRAQRPDGHERRVQVAGGQRDHAVLVRRVGERRQARGVHRPVTERDRLPGVVGRAGWAAAAARRTSPRRAGSPPGPRRPARPAPWTR